MKTIFRIVLLITIWSNGLASFAQYSIKEKNTTYHLTEEEDEFVVTCDYTQPINNSRHKNIVQSKLRLNAIEIICSYQQYKQAIVNYSPKEDLFELFHKYSNYRSNFTLSDWKAGAWKTDNRKQEITYTFSKPDFSACKVANGNKVNAFELFYKDFKATRNIESACRLFDFDSLSTFQIVELESCFLQNNCFVNSTLSNLLNHQTAYHLELSLYQEDSALNRLVDNIPPYKNTCLLQQIVLNKAIFTSIKSKAKKDFYDDNEDLYRQSDHLWYKTVSFIIEHCDSGLLDENELTLVKIIENYPGAINHFCIKQIYDHSEGFETASTYFSQEKIDEAIAILKDEINYNGVSGKTLNLMGASYRLKGDYKKAVTYLLLGFYINPEADYLMGNMILCLKQLNYEYVEELSDVFLSHPDIDEWSKSHIQKLKK